MKILVNGQERAPFPGGGLGPTEVTPKIVKISVSQSHGLALEVSFLFKVYIANERDIDLDDELGLSVYLTAEDILQIENSAAAPTVHILTGRGRILSASFS